MPAPLGAYAQALLQRFGSLLHVSLHNSNNNNDNNQRAKRLLAYAPRYTCSKVRIASKNAKTLMPKEWYMLLPAHGSNICLALSKSLLKKKNMAWCDCNIDVSKSMAEGLEKGKYGAKRRRFLATAVSFVQLLASLYYTAQNVACRAKRCVRVTPLFTFAQILTAQCSPWHPGTETAETFRESRKVDSLLSFCIVYIKFVECDIPHPRLRCRTCRCFLLILGFRHLQHTIVFNKIVSTKSRGILTTDGGSILRLRDVCQNSFARDNKNVVKDN